MRLVTYSVDKKEMLGAVTPCGTKILPLEQNGFPYKDMNDLITNITDIEKEALTITDCP